MKLIPAASVADYCFYQQAASYLFKVFLLEIVLLNLVVVSWNFRAILLSCYDSKFIIINDPL